ncbi:hypothetical protein [Streptomyces sp. Ag109_G2-15]|uniref:hypothetical protein n=1 Tax=Streptomyces sp. Ag109_G2-15 TaxID=1938850 RepID=UPI000BC67937|nr:hypothetical protein [Streptomyces sp. Ag109_G2-15]SOD84255.1 hypothetical protein SAMN06272765_1632 [Streptomyces sp. Ag109_G2-15]
MADEHNKWLTRDTAERLLRGESLEAVDASSSDQAERLAKALGALSAEAAPATGELPGEQAALAAFRKVREAAEAERTAAALGDGTPGRSGLPARGSDAGLVRIGAPTRSGIRARRPRWARPVRLALAAAVAAGTLGGVAMAAGSGVLPVPFHDDRPDPAASVSAAQSPGQPHTSPTPQSPQGILPSTDTPDGGTSGSLDPSGGATAPDQGTTPGSGDASGNPGTWWQVANAACRDLKDGKELGSDRRRALEGLAGGSSRVTAYCKSVLAGQYGSGGTGKGTGDDEGGKGNANGGGEGRDKGKGKDKGDENGQGGDDDGHPGRGHGHRHDRRGRAASPAPSAFAPTGADRKATGPVPTPSPSYTAL